MHNADAWETADYLPNELTNFLIAESQGSAPPVPNPNPTCAHESIPAAPHSYNLS
jgi:hypothetical protein